MADDKQHPRERDSEKLENGLSAIQNAKLERMATKGNWRKVRRWDTDSTLPEIQKAGEENSGELTLKEKALAAVHIDVMHADPRVRRIAASNILMMEAQNQADDHFEAKQGNGRTETEIDNEIAASMEELASGGQAPPAAAPESSATEDADVADDPAA